MMFSFTHGAMVTCSILAALKLRRRYRVLIKEMLLDDDAALAAHTEEALQCLTTSFAEACTEACTISLKKTNIMEQDSVSAPAIAIDDHTLEVVENFTYLGSTISSNLSLDAELNTRIGKASTATARLKEGVGQYHADT